MKANVRRDLRRIAEAAGAIDYELVRENRHLVIDYHFAGGRTVRQVMAATCSDSMRGLKNQIAELKRAVRN